MANRFYTYFIMMLLMVTSISVVSATQQDIGTKKFGDCIDLIQTCPDCNYVYFSSYTRPNGTREFPNWLAENNSITWTKNDCNITDQLGTWIVDGYGDIGGVDTEFSYTYIVTTTGNPTPVGMPMFQMGLIIVIFGISCFLLFLSSQMKEVAFKIFFLVISLIFLMASILTAYMVSMDGNVVAATNSTTLGLIIVLGAILIIIFAYILIRQTINALDMYRIKRGHEWNVNAGSKVGGYNTRQAY